MGHFLLSKCYEKYATFTASRPRCNVILTLWPSRHALDFISSRMVNPLHFSWTVPQWLDQFLSRRLIVPRGLEERPSCSSVFTPPDFIAGVTWYTCCAITGREASLHSETIPVRLAQTLSPATLPRVRHSSWCNIPCASYKADTNIRT